MTDRRPQLVPREQLTARQREHMFQLLAEHFEDSTYKQFEVDLGNKNWALLITDGAPSIVGFTTFCLYRTMYSGQRLSVVCSGDTIVERSRPECTALLRGWINALCALHAPTSTEPLYWLLIVSGFRTYRMMPVFWRHFMPRCDAMQSPQMRALLNHLARERYGADFDASTGLVRFKRPQRLRGELSLIPSGRLHDPHVEYFVRKNPNHARGDELACLTRIDVSNLTRAGLRMLGWRSGSPALVPAGV